jgi:hypothetical protein
MAMAKSFISRSRIIRRCLWRHKTDELRDGSDGDYRDRCGGDRDGSPLKAWDANGTVTKIGYDTIKVTIRAQKADATEYTYLENYLPFSGGNLTITAGCSDTTVQKKADDTYLGDKYTDNKMFEGQTASITYVKQHFPVVTIAGQFPGRAKRWMI